MKYIVTTGCSFTNFRTTWSDYLEEHFENTDTTVINVGYKGSSNDIILRGIITNVERLLSEGKEIAGVIIQLTTMERKFMISKIREYHGEFQMSPPIQNLIKRSSWSSWLMPLNEGFDNSITYWKNYYKYVHTD